MKYSMNVKFNAMMYLAKCDNVAEVARKFNVSKSSIYRWSKGL